MENEADQIAGERYLTMTGISKSFTTKGRVVHVLDGIEFTAARGSFVSIIGPSGCGKSTLLACVGGMDNPSTGRITVGGRVVSRPNRRLGYVFQEELIFPWRTALGNVRFALEGQGLDAEAQIEKARAMLRLVGLRSSKMRIPANCQAE